MTLERLDPIHQASLSILRLSWLPIPGDPAVAKRVYILFGMLLLAQIATAQTLVPTSTPAPWPPDPHAIFADGVQWEVVPPSPPPPTETPYVEPTYNPDYLWVCDGVLSAWALGEGPWVAVYPVQNDTRQGYLCNIEADEQRHALPPNESGYDDWDVYTTPDKTKLLLGLGFEFFAYDLEDDSYIKLGDAMVYSESDMLLCRWITDTLGVLCSRERQGRPYFPEEYFVFDITQPNSIMPAFKGWENDVFYDDELKRNVSLYGDMYEKGFAGGPPGQHTACHVTVYDAQGLREKELGYDCLPVFDEDTATPFYRYGDYLYYILVDEDEMRRTSLYRYSLVDETITEIIDDFEVKNIIAVSPDEQYIVILTDTDLNRFVFEARMGASCCSMQDYSWQIAIFEIQTGDLAYKSDDLGIYTPNQLIWVDDTTLILGAQMSAVDLPVNGSLIKLESIWRIELPRKTDSAARQFVKILTISDSSLDLPSPHGIYGFGIYEGFGAYERTLIDLRTFDVVPLLQSPPWPYDLEFEWQSDHALLVRVAPRDDDQPSITYRVILP
jgi:hypothetical protein